MRLAVLVIVCAVLAGCGADGSATRVLAASSLTDVAPALVLAHDPDLDVEFDFAGSNALVTQATEGRAADLLLTADAASMDRAVSAGVVRGDPVTFARNRLTLVVPRSNPGGVASLADLADPDLLVALCAPAVPCGQLTEAVLEDAGMAVTADSRDPSVRAVLTRVRTGAVDAGIVYVTDGLAAAEDVLTIDLPGESMPSTPYLAAVLTDARPGTEELLAFLTTDEAQAILAAAGFERP